MMEIHLGCSSPAFKMQAIRVCAEIRSFIGRKLPHIATTQNVIIFELHVHYLETSIMTQPKLS